MVSKLKLNKYGRLKATTDMGNGIIKTNLNPIDTIKTQNPGVNVYKTGNGLQVTGQKVVENQPNGMITTKFNQTVDIPAEKGLNTNKITSPQKTILPIGTKTQTGTQIGIIDKTKQGTTPIVPTTPTTSSVTTPTITTGTGLNFNEQTNKILNEDYTYTDDQGKESTIKMQDIFSALSPEQQSYVTKIGEAGDKAFKDALTDTLKTERDLKSQIEYNISQRGKINEINRIGTENQNLQIEAENKKTYEDLQSLKENINYFANSGNFTGTSSRKLDLLQNDIKNQEVVYDKIIKINSNLQKAKELNLQIDEAQFQKQLSDLNLQLKEGVDKTIQSAINDFNSYEIQGILDDPSKFQQISSQILSKMDTEISGLSDTAFNQRKFILDSFNKLAEEKQTYLENKNSLNKDMSSVKGYYVNQNGEPIMNEFGQKILIPTESPMEPVFDKEKGILYTFSENEKGELVANTQKLFTPENFDENIITGYLNAIQNGDLSLEGLLKSGIDKDIVNKVIAKYNASESVGGGQISGTRLNFTTNQDLINKYPNEAAFRNNNPTGITWGVSNELKSMWDNAGIKYMIGTPRPKAEGGNYVKFETIEDGLKAYTVSLTQRGDDIYDRLVKWVGTSEGPTYASNLMAKAGITKGEKFSSLDDIRLEKLMVAQLQKESPNFYKELVGGQGVQSQTPEVSGELPYENKILQEFDGKDITKLAKNLGVNEKQARNKYNDYLQQFEGLDAENIAFQITSILPRDMYKTDADMNRVVGAVRDGILDLKKQGKEVNQENVSDYIRGFNINEGANKDFTSTVKSVLEMNAKETDRNDWKTISNYINKEDYDNADKYISNFVEKLAKNHYGDEFVSKANINILTSDLSKLNTLISKNPDKIGAFDGRVTDFMKKFKDYPEMQELKTLLSMSQAGIRKYFAGSAVSEQEMSVLEDYIGGNDKMTPNNLLTMLKTVHGKTRDKMVEQRKNFGYTPLIRTKDGKLLINPSEEDEINNIFN